MGISIKGATSLWISVWKKMTCDLSLHNTQRMFRDFEDPNSKGKNNKTFMIKLGRKYS